MAEASRPGPYALHLDATAIGPRELRSDGRKASARGEIMMPLRPSSRCSITFVLGFGALPGDEGDLGDSSCSRLIVELVTHAPAPQASVASAQSQ